MAYRQEKMQWIEKSRPPYPKSLVPWKNGYAEI